MAKKEAGLLDMQEAETKETQAQSNETQENKQQVEIKDTEAKETQEQIQENKQETQEITNLESFKQSLKPQEKKVLETFMKSSVYDSFMSYLETFFREKDMLIHRINCYCFRAIDDFSFRMQGKVYEIKKGQIIYIQKDCYGNSLLRNNKLERIM